MKGTDNNFVIANKRDDCCLERERVLGLLQAGLEKPLMVVVAGAGFGKTYEVSNVLSMMEWDYIWLQLTDLDNLVARFWQRFVQSFQGYNPTIIERLQRLGYPTTPAAEHQLLHILEQELMVEKKFVIVLDDFHLLHNDSILAFIETVFTGGIGNLSVVLISRTKPPYSLSGLLSKGALVRVGEQDLRFTEEEMAAYYKQQGAAVNEKMLEKLYLYTEGWIFAIYLLGLSIKNESVCIDNLLSYAKIDIYELIEKEIFNMASPELRAFLVRVSILEVIPTKLMVILAGEHISLIKELSQISILVRHDLASDTYRLHNLFKSFLEEKARYLSAEEIYKIHLTAAHWYKKNSKFLEAVKYYQKCLSYSDLFSVILSVPARPSYEVADSFIQLIDEAPKEVLNQVPIMGVLRANLLFSNNRIQEACCDLAQIRARYEKAEPSKENLAVLGETYLTLALLSIVNQNLDFVELFKKADQCLAQGSRLVDKRLNVAEGLNVCGIKKPYPGELERFKKAMFEAAPYAARVMNGAGYGMEYMNAADVALMTGDFKNVEKYVYEAIYRATSREQFDVEYMANFYLIRLLMLKGNFTQVTAILTRLEEKTQRLNRPNCTALFEIILGWYYVKIGKPEQVARWIIEDEERKTVLAPVIVGREYLVRSDWFLVQEKYFELMAFMEQQDSLYEKRGILYALIQNEISRAIIYYFQGFHTSAFAALERAYALSSPNELIFQYIEYGEKMRTVVNAARQRDRCTIPKEWLDMIYTKASTYAKMLAKVVTSHDANINSSDKGKVALTKREKELLASLCTGLTREEMAVNFSLSRNTIKSTLQNLYNKLGATNSIDAVRIASAMDLLE